MSTITQKRLKELIEYNPKTGVFRWIYSDHGIKSGQVAGYINKSNHGQARNLVIDGKRYSTSKLAFLYMYAVLPKNPIFRVDKDTLNDSFENLTFIGTKKKYKNKKKANGYKQLHILVNDEESKLVKNLLKRMRE